MDIKNKDRPWFESGDLEPLGRSRSDPVGLPTSPPAYLRQNRHPNPAWQFSQKLKETARRLDDHPFVSLEQNKVQHGEGRTEDSDWSFLETGSGAGSGGGAGFPHSSAFQNWEYQERFPDISKEGYLIDTFDCVLQKDTSVEGRLYISESHVSFYANTSQEERFSLRILEITSLESLGVLDNPNVLQITTIHAEYRINFTLFLYRDDAYDVIDETRSRAISNPADPVAQTFSSVIRVSSALPPPESCPALLPPQTIASIPTVDDIRTLLATETGAETLLALDISDIPAYLDLLQKETKTKDFGPEYHRKCGRCLRKLVNKHNLLPPSLFRIVEEVVVEQPLFSIGSGASADVWRGKLGSQSVALKVLRAHIQTDEEEMNEELQKVYKEALLWTHLEHPNLLPFLGVSTTLFPGRLCLVSPLMGKGKITKFLKLHPEHDRLRVISDIAAGMSYLHFRSVVHGDIKGDNILVDEQGRCLLADFGLAGASMTMTLLSTATNSIMKGTTRWMAPELFTYTPASADSTNEDSAATEKPGKAKPAIDIYAFACTVYEIISGKLPFFHLQYDPQVMLAVLSGAKPERPTSVKWCPDNIWDLVQQCCEHESRLRPTAAKVHAFLSHLEELRREGKNWEQKKFQLEHPHE